MSISPLELGSVAALLVTALWLLTKRSETPQDDTDDLKRFRDRVR